MPNKNYLSGRAFEYRRKKFWSENGLTMLRTAGSHGVFDLIGFMPSGGVVGIQCKRVKKDAQAVKLINTFQANPPLEPGLFTQVIEVWSAESRQVMIGYVEPFEGQPDSGLDFNPLSELDS